MNKRITIRLFDQRKPFKNSGRKVLVCLLISISAFSQVVAETLPAHRYVPVAADSTPDKNTVRKLLHWVSIFTMFSNVDLSDKVDLKEYAEAADLAASFITNPELSLKISEFRTATFLNVYPKGLVYSNEWLFKKLNEVSDAQYSVMNAPYVTMEVLFTPVSNNTAYMVTIVFKGSPEVTHNLADANKAASDVLHGAQFSAPREGKEKINAAIFAGLDKLQQIVGSTYAPNIAIRYNEELYLNNQTLQVWQRTNEAITLSAVDRHGTMLSGVTWTNATASGEGTATYPIATTGTTKVTVRSGNYQVSVNVRVEEGSLDWKEILRQVLQEVINQLLVEGEEAVTQVLENRRQAQLAALNDQRAIENILASQQSAMTLLEITNAEQNLALPQTSPILVTTPPDDDRYTRAIASYLNFKKLLVDENLKEVRKVVLLLLLDPEHFEKLIKLMEADIPQVASELVVRLIRGEGRDELKTIVKDYLNQKLDAVIIQQLGTEMGNLYALINEGATRTQIREWLSTKASEKIIRAIN